MGGRQGEVRGIGGERTVSRKGEAGPMAKAGKANAGSGGVSYGNLTMRDHTRS